KVQIAPFSIARRVPPVTVRTWDTRGTTDRTAVKAARMAKGPLAGSHLSPRTTDTNSSATTAIPNASATVTRESHSVNETIYRRIWGASCWRCENNGKDTRDTRAETLSSGACEIFHPTE